MNRQAQVIDDTETPFTATDTGEHFVSMNDGYNAVFRPGRLSIGLVAPLAVYPHSPVPDLQDHLARVQLADELGFSALWLRDIPFNVPSFGDAGQLFDPFVYLGMLAGQTRRIALGAASIILPLRHPAHVAKSAASVDVLSNGRLILGVASGDRPEEFPAFAQSLDQRGANFRDSFDYIRRMGRDGSGFAGRHGEVRAGLQMLPRPHAGELPLLVTGGSQQSPDWVAANANGWMTYPRAIADQARVAENWRQRVQSAGRTAQPLMQPLYLDLLADAGAPAVPIHLGMRSGIDALRRHLQSLQGIGVHHVALNLRFNQADIGDTLTRLANELLPEFN